MSMLPKIRSSEVADGVYQLPSIGARVTAIEHDGDVLLIDTGARGSTPMVSKSLSNLGFGADRVRSIVLTHSHPDHAGSLSSLVERTGASVAIHNEEGDVLETHDDSGPLFGHLPGPLNRAISRRLYDGPVTPNTRFVADAALDWPDPVEVVHTPGHTPGSISLFIPKLKLVMVGDALQYRFRKLGGPAKLVTVDYARALRSLHRLLTLDFETIVFSHFQPMKRDAKRRLERLTERLEARTV